MDPWIIWLAAGCILLVSDILLQFVWGYCFAAGCLAALVSALSGTSPLTQFTVFGVTAVSSFFILFPILKKWQAIKNTGSNRAMLTGMESIIGRTGKLTSDVNPGETGRMKIDGDNWQVKIPDCSCTLPAGTPLIVTGHESIILIAKQKTNS